MHIHYFQHDDFEDLGFIGEWAEHNKFTTSVTRFDLKPELPSVEDFDWLVVLGGKMGVNDSKDYPWINEEIEFIKCAVESDKIVIGICLGSQMLASALGAKVYKNTEPETGFYPVNFNKNIHTDPVFRHFPGKLEVMHMHFDIFDLPIGAVAMAESKITPVQAFRFGNNIFAFQFHFEVTEANAPVFISEITPEIKYGSSFVQTPTEMLQNVSHCNLNNQVFAKVLNEILLITPS